jgi:hypothetical protein
MDLRDVEVRMTVGDRTVTAPGVGRRDELRQALASLSPVLMPRRRKSVPDNSLLAGLVCKAQQEMYTAQAKVSSQHPRKPQTVAV